MTSLKGTMLFTEICFTCVLKLSQSNRVEIKNKKTFQKKNRYNNYFCRPEKARGISRVDKQYESAIRFSISTRIRPPLMLFAFAVTAQLWNLVAQPLVWPERGEVLTRFRRLASKERFRAIFWATIASLILTWLRGLRSYVIDVSRVMYAHNVYRVDGRLLTRPCFRSLRNIRFLSHLFPFLSLSFSIFFLMSPVSHTRTAVPV